MSWSRCWPQLWLICDNLDLGVLLALVRGECCHYRMASHTLLPSILLYLLPSSSVSTSPPPLRNTSLYPACIEDTDCANNWRCFQYMCYPGQVGKPTRLSKTFPQQPPIRPTLGSAGVADEKTVLLLPQKRAAITGMIIISQYDDEYHNFDDNYLDESDSDDVTFQSNQEWELFSA